MRNYMLIGSIVVLAIIMGFTQDTDTKGLARVKQVDGIEVYVMSEPLSEYTVIEEVKGGMFSSTANMPIPITVEVYVSKAKKRADKSGNKLDAIIINSTSGSALLIKWKE